MALNWKTDLGAATSTTTVWAASKTPRIDSLLVSIAPWAARVKPWGLLSTNARTMNAFHWTRNPTALWIPLMHALPLNTTRIWRLKPKRIICVVPTKQIMYKHADTFSSAGKMDGIYKKILRWIRNHCCNISLFFEIILFPLLHHAKGKIKLNIENYFYCYRRESTCWLFRSCYHFDYW